MGEKQLDGITCFKKEIEWLILGSGLELAMEDFRPQKNLQVNIEAKNSFLEFCFCLSGKIRATNQVIKDEIIIEAGQIAFRFNQESKSKIKYTAGDPIRWVGIRLDFRLSKILPETKSGMVPAPFLEVLRGSGKNFHCHIGKMTASMRVVVHQILNCPYQDFSRNIYLKGKVMELLVYAIADLHSKNPSLLHSDERGRVLKAREILIHDLEEPPSLLELASKVGLNDCKLKAGFREVFGTTVFGYLRRERLECARKLLEEGMSVTEVSYSVGYSSLSHFAKAFARQFGVKPGKYLAEMRRKTVSE